MGCLIVLLSLISARLALVVLALFTNDLSRAFDSWLIPLAGFFLLPWTTLVYALLWTTTRHVDGIEWAFVAVAFLIDIGSLLGGGKYRRR